MVREEVCLLVSQEMATPAPRLVCEEQRRLSGWTAGERMERGGGEKERK